MVGKHVAKMGGMKQALITGGSSGIGLELAKLFANAGYDLLLAAKPEAELQAAKATLQSQYPNIAIQTLAIDLSQSGSAAEVYEFAGAEYNQVSVLVNNAGFGTYGFINDIDIEQDVAMIQLHIVTLYRLTRLFLRDMVRRDDGYILNLSSVSAFQANPMLATYGATKSFVLQFSRAIAYELREKKSKVKVTAVCPTPVKQTGFQARAGMQNTNTFDNWMVVTADVVARDAFSALFSGRDMVIPGSWLFVLVQKLTAIFPDAWIMHLSRFYLQTR
jgi:short-subunit dehydrogenase